MRRKLIIWTALGLVGVWITSAVMAEVRQKSHSGSETLTTRLDEFGRLLFGGVLPLERRAGPQKFDAHPARGQSSLTLGTSRAAPASRSSGSRAGSSGSARSIPTRATAGKSTTDQPAVHRIGESRLGRRPTPPAGQSGSSAGSARTLRSSAPAELSTLRLHQRVTALGESAFPDIPRPKSKEAHGSAVEPSGTDTSRAQAANSSGNSLQPSESRSAFSGADSGPTPAAEPKRAPTVASSPSPEAANLRPSAQPRKAADVLIVRQSPILGVETIGPRQIKVGKESTFEMTIRNSGQVAADQVVVTIGVPQWADVLGAEVSKGATTTPKAGREGSGFQWEVGQVGPRGEERLSLRIVPRQSLPFDLTVEWDSMPVVSHAMIEVQEPKLEMRLEGPREVLFGQSEVYRLELTNSGTGDAEDVTISLAPTGSGENLPARHNFGLLKAGEKKAIEVELTARQTGTLDIRVDAQGDGVEAHLAETITVNRPALEMEVEAPEIQYVGTDTDYLIRVRNGGTAPAKNVAVRATIPPGTEYVSCTDGGHVSPDQASVTWTLETLDVRAEKSYELTCKLALAGLSRLKVASSAAGGLAASSDAAVKVEAIADLELDVTDPSGPVRVGSEAAYQVRVRNQGTRSAEEVEIVAYFSKGIEPTEVEGGQHKTGPGQVVFDKIPSLAAGQEVTLQIKAKAETAGNHICRVEVYCKPLGTRLVGEETTHFYGGASVARKAASSEPEDDASSGRHGPIRTADQHPTPAPSKNR